VDVWHFEGGKVIRESLLIGRRAFSASSNVSQDQRTRSVIEASTGCLSYARMVEEQYVTKG